jgi:ring-1,2-phenylacetyl-CoA epoxidase subunit PaaC
MPNARGADVAQELATATKAAELDDATRGPLRDLILVLADTKRLLGMRYADWILGAPELEAGIACASMAQDEWGHGRLFYALLRDFGEDVGRLEHGRDAGDYRSMELLDRAPESWPELVALNAFADMALTLQLEALTGSAYAPLRQRVEKVLDEERFHGAHGVAWFRRIAQSSDAARDALREAAERMVPSLLLWFGPDDGATRALRDGGIVGAAGSDLRTRFLERVAPLLALADAGPGTAAVEPDFADFDAARRRSGDGGGPDAETITQVRGDRNRAFLMD